MGVALFVGFGMTGAAAFAPQSSSYRDFMPHGYCYLWDPLVLWLNVTSDILITISYYCIPVVLIYFARKNRDLPFNRIFWMFGTFILACGTTHLMEVWNIWHGNYLLAGGVKAFTAAVSVITAVMIVPLIPRAVTLPHSIQLLNINRQLEKQIASYRGPDAAPESAMQRRATFGFVAAVVLTCFVSAGFWYSARLSSDEADLVAHTDVVMNALTTTAKDVIDIETGARGFALTGQESFLEPYTAGTRRLPEDMATLQQLIEDPKVKQQLDRLKPQVDAAAELCTQRVMMQQTLGVTPDLQLLRDGKRRVDAVRSTIEEMQAKEKKLLAERSLKTESARRMTKVTSILGIVLGVGVLSLSWLSLRRQIELTGVSQVQMSRFNAELGHRVEERTAEMGAINQSLEREIRARADAERDLRESQDRLSGIIGSAMDAVVTVDDDHRIVLFNKAAEKMFRCPMAEAMGQPVERFIPERFRAHHSEHIRNFATTGTTSRSMGTLGAISGVRADGEEFPIEASISQVEAGGKMLFTVILRDISERKQAEEALRESQTRLAGIIGSAMDAIITIDEQQRVVLFNTAAERMFGFTASEALQSPIERFIPERFRSGHSSHIRRFSETGTSSRAMGALGAIWGRRANGEEFPVEAAISQVEAGGKKLFTVILRDITQRKNDEREIRYLYEDLERRVQARTAQLEAANKELEAFTYSVSHDLRAPLRHISGFSKILMEEFGPALPAEAQEHLHRIQDGTRRMGTLVDDLLSLGRIGRQEVRLQVTSLDSIVQEIMAEVRRDCEGRQMEWKIGKLPFVDCDAGLLRQVFQNLLGNAVKFTRTRTPAIIEVGQLEQNGSTVIYVRDNGVGFSMKYSDKLFGVFQRLHRAEDFEGTGVGLATVQRIIQKHGGHIWAEAELDKGATFYFTLGNAGTGSLAKSAPVGGKA